VKGWKNTGSNGTLNKSDGREGLRKGRLQVLRSTNRGQKARVMKETRRCRAACSEFGTTGDGRKAWVVELPRGAGGKIANSADVGRFTE